jgi:hypothetical protein
VIFLHIQLNTGMNGFCLLTIGCRRSTIPRLQATTKFAEWMKKAECNAPL